MQNLMAKGYLIHSQNHGDFTIAPELWLKNQQQQTVLLRYLALPLAENGQTLWLGLDSLTNLSACEAFSFLTGKTIEPVLIESQTLKTALQDLSPRVEKVEENQPLFYSALSQEQPTQPSDEPIIRLLNDIFESATAQKASDIHLEPQADYLQTRFRIDGVLQVQNTVPLSIASRLISRLKLLAKLDISETRLPQDGRFQFKTTFSDTLDFRLSTLATQFGEKAVLRLQQNRPVQLAFGELGMTESQQQCFRRALSQPQGLILVTGPTGSGKSISLYTALQYLNTSEKHIMTAEDPIEIQLPGIIQSQVNPPIGLDFSRLLRTFLRQDPDIIMLGEIRDEESAAMALRAAQTGHLVLSTLHTNDAPSAISRLQQLGIQRHEIDGSLLLVIAQRLVRKRCQKCGGNATRFCDCHQGYKGRIGIYQFLQPNLQHPQGYETDFADLRQSALEKLKDGTTDLTEIQRVLGQAHD
ncbi:GspE/PulE family protein [Aggregatibacter actinomycetemcomitans]|uniref:GspE/PulE family protein n=1 Tax=Aggregatibacter actinomycetemcomitans TaxID=714 RepID=UPI00022ADCFA|nr:GspE/PulE family protein [Aggregatibacter actinomycetemcomitans]KOE64127.1 protein transporter HofB [Aggregatibacter actinomycetemcomitans serotype e str. SCC393]KOE66730.1 protein transporter HofB [Aggregatibacter actinomycetemcomitans serotype e str. A160]KYK79935.1 protein transporter HofB [Aggregatibacter actinomycetemcomitans serotype e str. SA2876]